MQHTELRAEYNDSICFVPGRIHQPLWSSISVLDIFHINGSRLTANDFAVTKPERLHSEGQTFINLCIIWNAMKKTKIKSVIKLEYVSIWRESDIFHVCSSGSKDQQKCRINHINTAVSAHSLVSDNILCSVSVCRVLALLVTFNMSQAGARGQHQ